MLDFALIPYFEFIGYATKLQIANVQMNEIYRIGKLCQQKPNCGLFLAIQDLFSLSALRIILDLTLNFMKVYYLLFRPMRQD